MESASSFFEVMSGKTRRKILFTLLESEKVDIEDGLVTRGGTTTKSQPETSTTSPPEPPQPTGIDVEVSDSDAADSERVQPTRILTGDDEEEFSLSDDEIELRYHHLPLLEKHDLIEYDRETKTISRGAEFRKLRPTLEAMVENSAQFPLGTF